MTPRRQRSLSLRAAFSLIELLVVVAIIGLLLTIAVPGLGMARAFSRTAASLSNLRQLGQALRAYSADHLSLFPLHSSDPAAIPRTRWADYLYPYASEPGVFLSPALETEEEPRMIVPFAHTVDPMTGAEIAGTTEHYGGYGYNYQYLGNSRTLGNTVAPYHATASTIKAGEKTVSIGDVRGSKNGVSGNPYGVSGKAVYAADPPLGSMTLGSLGSRASSATPGAGNAYYTGGSDGNDDHRSIPAERNHRGLINYVFIDGHGASMTREEIDQIDTANPNGNNAYWNGGFDRANR